MRFRLVSSWGRLLQLYVDETLIPVRCPSLRRQHEDDERLAWTWLDGAEYALLRPTRGDGQLRIVSAGEIVCCGQMFFGLSLWQSAVRHGRATVSQWTIADCTIVCDGVNSRCCKLLPTAFTLRQLDGIRLAVYCRQRGRVFGRAYNGVVRDNLPKTLVPIVFAIILAGTHAPDLFMGSGGG